MGVGIFAHKGGKYFQYGLILSSNLVIIQDARPEIGNTLLTLNAWIGQRAYRLPFHIDSWPITRLEICVTIQPFECQNAQTKMVDAPLTLR